LIDLFQRGNADRWKPTHSIGIITTCGTYERFIPEWAASIHGLATQPDKIVIAAQDPDAVRVLIEDSPIHADIVTPGESFQFGTYLNHAVTHCDTDWIIWLGVDDLYHPTALDGLRESKADVRIYGMQYGKSIWRGGHPRDCLQYNPAPCGSPFRRWIWEQRPFDPAIAPFEDWAFWISAYYLGARFEPPTGIDFTYRKHDDQIAYDDAPNAERVRDWARAL